MDSIVKKVLDITTCERKNRDWDRYRNYYLNGKLSFKQLKEINNTWFAAFQNQEFHNTNRILNCFNKIPIESRNSVLELGCYRGALANCILNKIDGISNWYGYDICDEALNRAVCAHESFKIKRMDDWFHQDIFLPWFETFVSTHTLEHLSNAECLKTLDWVRAHPCCDYIIIELPVPEAGKIWRGGGSSHVMSLGRMHFREYFAKNNWDLVSQYSYRINWGALFKRG